MQENDFGKCNEFDSVNTSDFGAIFDHVNRPFHEARNILYTNDHLKKFNKRWRTTDGLPEQRPMEE